MACPLLASFSLAWLLEGTGAFYSMPVCLLLSLIVRGFLSVSMLTLLSAFSAWSFP